MRSVRGSGAWNGVRELLARTYDACAHAVPKGLPCILLVGQPMTSKPVIQSGTIFAV